MKTDRYTKVILTLIAIGLFLNVANNFNSEAHASGEEKVEKVECVNCLTESEIRSALRTEIVNVEGTVDAWPLGTAEVCVSGRCD